jgi:hypothetical protein
VVTLTPLAAIAVLAIGPRIVLSARQARCANRTGPGDHTAETVPI